MFGNRENEIRRGMREKNYRISNEAKTCANCAHMEILESGPYKGYCMCRSLDYIFANTDQEKSHICDIHMEGSQLDGLINEMATLVIESHYMQSDETAEIEAKRRKLNEEREVCLRELSHKKGLFSGKSRRALQKRIRDIERELKNI